MVEEHLHNLFYRAPRIIACKDSVEDQVLQGELTPTLAVQQLINTFIEEIEPIGSKSNPILKIGNIRIARIILISQGRHKCRSTLGPVLTGFTTPYNRNPQKGGHPIDHTKSRQ